MANLGEPVNQVEVMYEEFVGRRNGIIKALTTDYAKVREIIFAEKNVDTRMCLYGLPNGDWKVGSLSKSTIPEAYPLMVMFPKLGVNQAAVAEEMSNREFIIWMANWSEAWLYGHISLMQLDREIDMNERQALYGRMCSLPTIARVVTTSVAYENLVRKEMEEENDMCYECKGEEIGSWVVCDCGKKYHFRCSSVESLGCQYCLN